MAERKAKVKTKQPVKAAVITSQQQLTALHAIGESVDATAEYARADETEFLVPEISFLPELTAGGTQQLPRAYNLCWIVPKESDPRGAVLELGGFDAEILNEGPFPLSIIAMQPHGYEAAPTSIAAWVSLGDFVLEAGKKKHFRVTPIANNFVVPLRTVVGSKDVVMFLSLSINRQHLTTSGDKVSDADLKREVGIRCRLKAHYKSAGNTLGAGEYFATKCGNSDGLYKIDPLPMPATTFGAFRPPGKKFVYFCPEKLLASSGFVWKDGLYLVPYWYRDVQDDAGKVPFDSPGAEQWILPFDVQARDKAGDVSIARYMRKSTVRKSDGSFESKWIVTNICSVVEARYEVAEISVKQYIAVMAHEQLLPVYSSDLIEVATRCKKLRVRKMPSSLTVSQGPHTLSLGGWKEDVLKSVSFIVRVIKVAAMVATAAGLMNVLEEEESSETEFYQSAIHVASSD